MNLRPLVSGGFAIAFGMLLFSRPVDAAAFTNGSFEVGPAITPEMDFANLANGDTSISGWIVRPSDIDYVSSAHFAAQDGGHSLDLSGCAAGGIEQTFDTTPGATYVVSFYMAGNPYAAPSLKEMDVGATGNSSVHYTFDITGHSASAMGWLSKQYTFVASGSSTTLFFQSTVSTSFGPALDNVSVALQGTTNPGLGGCANFENGTSGFVGVGTTLTLAAGGPSGLSTDVYLRTHDEAGESYVRAPSFTVGNYSALGAGASLCYDVRLFNDGNTNAHDLDPPWFMLVSPAGTAAFQFSAGISEDGGSNPGWHHLCAPLGGSSPPTTPFGVWIVNGSWSAILANVTELRLSAFDFTNYQTEEAGYDNLCLASVQTGCVNFEGGTPADPYSGFSSVNVTLDLQTPGASGDSADHFLRSFDEAGDSWISAPVRFLGNHTGLNMGAAICYDVRLFDDGNPNAHDQLTPWIVLKGPGTTRADFVFSVQISEVSGWRHVCAPLGPRVGNQLPSGPDGYWTITNGTAADWDVIRANVTDIRLSPFDVTSGPWESAGYDNFCFGAAQPVISVPVPAMTPISRIGLVLLLGAGLLTAGGAVKRRWPGRRSWRSPS